MGDSARASIIEPAIIIPGVICCVIAKYAPSPRMPDCKNSRLDFDMEAAPENRNEIEEALNAFVSADMRISDEWITEGELAQNPNMIKTLAVQPPRGSGYIRLVRISDGIETIDLQPCGGTHVLRTGEIGTLRIGKIEKKGRMNRRVYLYSDV